MQPAFPVFDPQRYRKDERFVATLSDYEDVHRSIAKRQYEYIAEPRSNYVKPLGSWFEILAPDEAMFLPAPNMEARISFARSALAQLRTHRELRTDPVCFVTISPRECVFPIEIASHVNLHALKALTRQALAGHTFIGMVDFGLFKSWGARQVRELNNHVSVHTHLLVFGATSEEIQASFDRMGFDFSSVTRASAGFVMTIEPEQIEGYLLYLLKAPLFEYKVEHREDGNGLKLGKHPLRTGDQLRMAAVLSEMYIDELFFGQHAGTALARAIKAAALEPFKVFQRQHPDEHVEIARSVPWEKRATLSTLVRTPPNFLRYARRFGRLDPEDDGSPNDQPFSPAYSYLSDLNDMIDL